MFVIDKFSINCSEKIAEDIFIRIHIDTEGDTYSSALDKYFRNEFAIRKEWIGWVDTNQKQFEIRRARLGILKQGISIFEIHGRFLDGSNQIQIEIKPRWYSLFGLIWAIIFVSIIVFNFFNDIYGWIFIGGLVILEVLLWILDFRKIERKLNQYIELVLSVSAK